MAKFYYKNPHVMVNGVDLSSYCASATVEYSWDEIETTSFGSNGKRERQAGLEDGSVSLEFHQDFAAATVDATIAAIAGSTAPVRITPAGSAASATNPSFRGTAVVLGYNAIDGSVGDLATFSVTWPITGGWARATA
jgi:hypothetical protein